MSEVELESTGVSTESKPMPYKIPQPHGGALNSGGTPGNKGGSKPRSAIRDQCKELFERKGLTRLEKILQSDDTRNSDHIKAGEVLARYGIGELKEVVVSDALILEAVVSTCQELGHDVEQFLTSLKQKIKQEA